MTKKKKKPKVKKVYIKEEPKFSKEEIREDIKKLEERKSNIGKGIKGALQKAQINRAIFEKRKTLGEFQKSELIKQQTARTKQQIELQKSKNELAELQKKNQVNFDGFIGNLSSKKEIKLTDLY